MDLVDLIEEKRFLGQEFLTWLWYKSEERGGAIALPTTGDVVVYFEQHMLLESGEGESHEKVICQGQQSELKEAKTGLAMGKKLEQGRLRLTRDDHEWRLSLSGGLMQFRSVRVPKTLNQGEEAGDEAGREGQLLDRIGLLETAIRTVDELFRLYLSIRLSPEWPTEKDRISSWIGKR